MGSIAINRGLNRSQRLFEANFMRNLIFIHVTSFLVAARIHTSVV